tara:strand:- start:1747 stop:2118 length:372 start_codon:yes stop_codon:yes gene_type:complete
VLGDERGSLIVMDKLSGVPFEIKRVYQILGTKDGVARGFHAHKKLHQLAICVSGNCRMVLDDGEIREDVEMNSPSTGIGIPPMLWHEMYDFSDNCVMVVLASDYYDESDYIRDYQEFREYCSK